jgi:hypothetical protein
MIARAASNDAALLGEVRMQLCEDADTLPVSLWLLDRGADMADRPTRSLHVDRADAPAPGSQRVRVAVSAVTSTGSRSPLTVTAITMATANARMKVVPY